MTGTIRVPDKTTLTIRSTRGEFEDTKTLPLTTTITASNPTRAIVAANVSLAHLAPGVSTYRVLAAGRLVQTGKVVKLP